MEIWSIKDIFYSILSQMSHGHDVLAIKSLKNISCEHRKLYHLYRHDKMIWKPILHSVRCHIDYCDDNEYLEMYEWFSSIREAWNYPQRKTLY